MNADPKVIVALDFPTITQAGQFVSGMRPELCKLKVGLELFTAAGPEFVRRLVDAGYDVFLDLKFHDIPNTVKQACASATGLGVWMMNVHALGGERMMRHGLEGANSVENGPRLIAVTILTSHDQAELDSIGIETAIPEQVEHLATMAMRAGLDGVVCSAQEASRLREVLGPDALLVTPGIRLHGGDVGDQKRIMTPTDAIRAGASYLVMGRPITQAEHPLSVLDRVNNELAGM